MKLSAIVAVDQSKRIAVNGAIPWKLRDDLKRFRAVTEGHVVIMGSRTFASIGRVLPGRKSLVLSRMGRESPLALDPRINVAVNLDTALMLAEVTTIALGAEEAFVIGGADVYRQLLPQCDRIYLTRVDDSGPLEGATLFPWDALTGVWKETDATTWQPVDERNSHRYQFSTLERVTP